MEQARQRPFLGRMSEPTSASSVKGPCGEEIEFYFVIKDGRIEDIKFYTEGCVATVDCGSMTAKMAQGKSISEALGISPRDVIEALPELPELPEEHCHCSILAVATLHRAIANHLLNTKR